MVIYYFKENTDIKCYYLWYSLCSDEVVLYCGTHAHTHTHWRQRRERNRETEKRKGERDLWESKEIKSYFTKFRKIQLKFSVTIQKNKGTKTFLLVHLPFSSNTSQNWIIKMNGVAWNPDIQFLWGFMWLTKSLFWCLKPQVHCHSKNLRILFLWLENNLEHGKIWYLNSCFAAQKSKGSRYSLIVIST